MDQAERILAGEVGADRLLDQAVAKTGPADWLLIDCSPGVSTLNVSALATARLHLAPVDARPISSETLGDTSFRRRHTPRP
jgi:cellulose biosynthesis protein BcsQ